MKTQLICSKSAYLACLLALLLFKVDMNTWANCEPLFIDLLFGEPIPVEMMMDDLASVRIIYVGELHTIRRHHRFQADLLQLLAERKTKLALGLEMFTEAQQPILDQWQEGQDSVGKLILELGKDRWTNLQDYESILLLARSRGIPVIGLNAPDSLVRKVARGGLDSLSDSEKQSLPEGVLSGINPLHERLLKLKLQVHRAFRDRSLDHIVLAQSLRDATMARGVERFLASSDGQDCTILVLAGTGHLNYGFGIPERVSAANSLPFRIVLPSESGELVLSEEEKRQSVPIEISHHDLQFIKTPIADYLHVVPLRKSEKNTPDNSEDLTGGFQTNYLPKE